MIPGPVGFAALWRSYSSARDVAGGEPGSGGDHFKSDVRRTPTHVVAKESK